MQIDLAGKKAIVTGSTAGIGLATATGLARAGAHVVINGRSQSSVDDGLERILKDAPNADVTGFAGDLGTAEGCEALVQAHPECDILVNNLGIFGPQDFFEIPDSEWERFFHINVMSGVRLSRAYAQKMVDKGWGRIVFLASESGLNIPPDMIHYGFTKTAYMAIARGLAKRLSATGVTVNSVLPGPTLSEGVRELVDDMGYTKEKSMDEAAAQFVKENRPSSIIQRAATVEEVANMIVYVCSKEASATTGAALRVDGGIVDTIA
ncbi:oxidoreductase [Oceanidesulfovibrio indonesiensis]|uniref:Oxidoreductase n=1 Tax=Oceanidesulfovibrio indonesiensis TaxID=54767 RepID=A0A7M3MBV4_9BACT|nr:SDR family oxidoreductase [Oceanidesulfovibrio indonesiensis]TVM15342.1 oxidoreductase [Oceanidesulfovibrio indonesiensis]